MRSPAAPTRSSSCRSTSRSSRRRPSPSSSRRWRSSRERPLVVLAPGPPRPRHERAAPRSARCDRVRVRRRQPGGPRRVRRRVGRPLRRARWPAVARHRHAGRPAPRRVPRDRGGRCPLIRPRRRTGRGRRPRRDPRSRRGRRPRGDARRRARARRATCCRSAPTTSSSSPRRSFRRPRAPSST